MKRKIIFAGLIFFVLSLMFFIMIFPKQKIAHYCYNDGDIVSVYLRENATKKDEATIIDVKGIHTEYIVLKFIEPSDTIIGSQIYLGHKDNYKIENKYNATALPESKYAFYTVNETEYDSIMINSDQDWSEVEFHSGPPEITLSRVVPNKLIVMLAVIITVLMSSAAFFIQGRIDVLGMMLNYAKSIWKNKKNVIKPLLVFAGTALVSYILSIIIEYDYFCILGLLLIVGLFVNSKKIIRDRAELVVLGVILIIGSVMIIMTNTAHESYDVESHYKWALNDSYLGRGCSTQADYDIYSVHPESFMSDTLVENNFRQAILNRDYGYVIAYDYEGISIPHLPSGVAIAIVRFFGGDFTWIYKAGEFGNLITYALLCYLGMRKLKSGKMIMAIIAMFPTNLLFATNYSYDFWVTGFSLLGMAYFIGNCQSDEKHISIKDTVVMVSGFVLACLPKSIYIPFLFLPFFMPKSKIKDKKKYYAICIMGFGILFIKFVLTSLMITGGSGDLRGDTAVYPAGQIMYILGNPFEYINMLIRFIIQYLSIGRMNMYIADMAYLGMAEKAIDVIIILLIITAFTDKCDGDNYKTSMFVRIYSILMYIGTSALIATAMYISFTSVGSALIQGCQERYIVPLLFPLLVTLGSGKIKNNMNKSLYNYLITVTITVLLFYNIYTSVLVKML